MPSGARLLAVAAAMALFAAASQTNARTLQLGASLEAVEADYPEAAVMRTAGDTLQTLRLRDVDHAGVRWALVEFVFDVSHHLSLVRLHTNTASFAQVQQLVLDQMQHPLAGRLAADAAGGEPMQIKLCQNSETGVIVTLEHPALSA